MPGQIATAGAVPILRPASGKLENVSLTNVPNRNVKNVQHNLPAGASRVMTSPNAFARRLTPNNSASLGNAVGTSTDISQTSALQNSSVDTSLSNDVVSGGGGGGGMSRIGALSQPPLFAVPNSSSHHKDARYPSSSPVRGLNSSLPTTSQVLSTASSSMTQSLHLPNGLKTLPHGHPMARTALLGTVVGNSAAAGVLGLAGPSAKGQESVSAAAHLLGTSGSHVASKHLSSSS